MRNTCLIVVGVIAVRGVAQNLTPEVIASCGGHGSAGGVSIEWTVGDVATATFMNGGTILTQGFHQPPAVRVRLSVSTLLEGPWNAASGWMYDSLRAQGWIPLIEPYTSLGYAHAGGGGETTSAAVLTVTGANAIVDWLFVELRSAADNEQVITTRSALLQRDGDVVDVDGTSPVAFQAPAGSYHVAVHHRDHLGVMTLAPVTLTSSAIAVDFTDGSTATYGTDAQKLDGAVRLSWGGDISNDGILKYTGANNDRDPILVAIGGSVPTATISGYYLEDMNMDGTVKYTGASNDRDPILVNIGGSVPTNTRSEQMP